MTEFEKWWNDPKKHRKRCEHWLPHWRMLAAKIESTRSIRYFTLCARSMIDIFMLVSEKILSIDGDSHSIPSVRFCEREQEQFVEIKDMVAREDAGFLGQLEELVLFKDDDFTAQCPTPASIAAKLEDEHLQEDYERIDRLQLKRAHFGVMASFPHDLMNLDFCDYYYPDPPDMLRINETIKRILDWQRRPSEDEEAVELDEFVLAVTCRHDSNFPEQAEDRLAALIDDNCTSFPEYKRQLLETRGAERAQDWIGIDKQDFFFAGWPKDIALSAKEYGWSMEILDYVYYTRTGDHDGNVYIIACLVARFARAKTKSNYLPAALFALDVKNRILIDDVDPNSQEGRQLLADLEKVVKVRNEQAERMHCPQLPDPKAA
jgi:hypothetical protein